MSTRSGKDPFGILGTSATNDGHGRILGRAKPPARSVGVDRLRAIGHSLGWSPAETERAIALGIVDGVWIDGEP